MKHLKLFFALFAMLALGVGNAWGAEETVTFTNKDWSPWTKITSGSSFESSNSKRGVANNGVNGSCKSSTSYTNITKISYVASSNTTGGKVTIKVGNTTVGESSITKDNNKTYSYDVDNLSGVITLSVTKPSSKTVWVKSITIVTSDEDEPGNEETVLSVEPKKVDFGTKNIYFESEKQGSLEIEITGQNLTGDVTAALSGIDANIFDLSQESFTPEDGEVSEKLTVSYEVSGEKGYTATLTLSSDGVDAIELPITLTTVNKKPTIYTKVTDAATLSAGDKVIFVYEAGKKAAGALSSGYLTSIDIAQAINTTANPATVSITDEAVIEYTLGGTTGAWEFISASGKLSEASANSTKSVDLAYNKGTTWTIAISSGNATIKGTTNTIQYNEANPRFKTYTSGQKTIQLYAISVPKYAVIFTQPEGGELIVKNGETAITSGNTFAEGIKLTVTATPANGYEGGTVIVKDADGNDVTATVYADGVLTMPAYAVTISATFEKKPCELLAKPTVSATTTYSSATLTWEAVANAAKYSVKVGTADAVETTETSYEVTSLNAETTYTYQVQAIAEADQDTYCDSEVAEGTFTTATAPTATLTLSDIEGTTTKTGALNGTITLPTEAAECSKTFVGWDADENCNHAPTYAPGAEYTLAAETQTLYAVYADGEGGGDFTITKTMSEIVATNGYTVSAGNTAICYTSLTLDENITLSTTGQANCGSFWSDPCEWRLYQNKSGNAIVTATNGCTLTSVKFTFTVSNTGVLLNNGSQMKSNTAVAASGASVTYTVGNSGSATNGQVRITAIEVSYSKEGEYSNFSTSCVEALNAPTFSPAGGTFTTEQNITLYAEEGDIYYTLDGSNPTKESNKYENIPVLLDECGTTTIKAIAISAESKSSIASATYTINLPITNTTATAYTPAEAIAIIDGECDKTEEVFVKGVVVSTSAFSAEYGNYDVIVKAVDDNSATPTTFTFYHMYKAASQTKFTASDEVIGVGDIITAKGKLTKYYSTYELADGCYMVERVAYTEPKTDISNTLETAYTVDKAFELISDIKSDLDKEVYVKGLVAVASTELYEEKYLTYSISDNGQNSGNVLKVYDGLNIDGVAFTSKDDVKVGDYVVVKGKLLNYKGTYEINKYNQLVQHKKAATITVSDITMEVGETKTIAATITPAAAETAVTYTIKENAANAISLSNNVITANAVGTATITATIATAADYMGKTVDFTVTVNAKSTKEKVVILAKYGDQWYAMMAQYVSGKTSHLAALPVTYVGGKLYNVADADKSLIEWERAIVDGKATFKNGSNYLTGKSGKTDLTLATTAYEWTIDGDSYLTGDRTFLYNAENNWFRHFGISNAGNKNYSGMPVVTAPVYATGQAYGRTSAAGKFGTICLPFGSTNYTGATFYEFVGSETGKVYLGSVTTLEAGVPYIFEASAAEVAVYGDGTTAATPGNSNGLYGTFTDNTEVAVGNYILKDNALCQAEAICWVNAYRAYIVMSEVPTGVPTQMPGRRYIGMSVQGENETTGVEDLFTTDAPVKVIENGQLIIIRDGVKYNVQGQKL